MQNSYVGARSLSCSRFSGCWMFPCDFRTVFLPPWAYFRVCVFVWARPGPAKPIVYNLKYPTGAAGVIDKLLDKLLVFSTSGSGGPISGYSVHPRRKRSDS